MPTGKKTVQVTLPDYIEQDLWDDFMEVRKAKKAVNSERALKILLRRIEKFRLLGADPVELIENAIMNSWLTVYIPKQERQFGGYGSQSNSPSLTPFPKGEH